MNIQLIQGEFSAPEALDLITQMIHIKIKFHEGRIRPGSTEEDIKYRESRVKHLQQELFQVRQEMAQGAGRLKLGSVIHVTPA